MDNINEKLKLYYRVHADVKTLTEKEKKLNKEIKDYIEKNKLDNVGDDEINAKIIVQNRSSLDEEYLMTLLKNTVKDKKTLDAVIKTKEYIDGPALETAVYHGQIDTRLIKTATVVKLVKTLKVTKNDK